MENELQKLKEQLLELENEIDNANKLITDMAQEQVSEMKEHQDFCAKAKEAVQNERIKIINEIKSISMKSLTADNVIYYIIDENDLNNLIEEN